ncbi:MAG TPA: YihY/virulence factor BrkB family protein [Tangfeifania sp.]|nr:YihY/virulence factor BrkB family protein [Tangfeifania sp.]
MVRKKITSRLVDYFKVFKKAIGHFGENRPVEHAGTTAYFAIFSMAPILIIIIAVFGYFTGDEAISQKLFDELSRLVGDESTQVLKNAIENYDITEKSTLGTIFGATFFLVSATTLFSAMQNSINYIWRIKVKSKLKWGVFNLLKTRLLSFGVILCLGFVILISLVADATIAFLKDFLAQQFTPDFVILAEVLNLGLSLAIIAAIFALIYRYLPDLQVTWSASWFGAIFASVLFALGKIGIGAFIGNSNLGVVYGAASSFVIILVWIFFVSIIFYFGVELSYQFSKYYNHDNTPAKYAVPFIITGNIEKETD